MYEYRVLLWLLLLLCVAVLLLLLLLWLLLLFVMIHLPPEVVLHTNASTVVLTVNLFGTNENTLRYSSCRYNERQLIHVTVVRRVRPRAERRYHAYHYPLTNKQIAIQLYN